MSDDVQFECTACHISHDDEKNVMTALITPMRLQIIILTLAGHGVPGLSAVTA